MILRQQVKAFRRPQIRVLSAVLDYTFPRVPRIGAITKPIPDESC